jgi:hypothetical protein
MSSPSRRRAGHAQHLHGAVWRTQSFAQGRSCFVLQIKCRVHSKEGECLPEDGRAIRGALCRRLLLRPVEGIVKFLNRLAGRENRLLVLGAEHSAAPHHARGLKYD